MREVEHDPDGKGGGVEAGVVVDQPGEPAAGRHPRAAEHQQGGHPPCRLRGREQLADRNDIGWNDAAEAEAEYRRHGKQAGFVLGQQKPYHRSDLP